MFSKFGQIYVSATYPGVVKAWHYHRLQTDEAREARKARAKAEAESLPAAPDEVLDADEAAREWEVDEQKPGSEDAA